MTNDEKGAIHTANHLQASSTFFDLLQVIAQKKSENQLAALALQRILDVSAFDKGVAYATSSAQRPIVLVNQGVDPAYAQFVIEQYATLPGYATLDSAAPLVVEDILDHPNFNHVQDKMRSAGIRAVGVFPLHQATQELRGAVTIYANAPKTLGPSLIKHIQGLANLAGLGICNMRLKSSKDFLLQENVLQKSHEVVSRLLAGVTHDFNNMLGGMLGLVSLAPSLEKQELQDLCNRLKSSVDHASRLSRVLLQLSKQASPERNNSLTELVSSVRDALLVMQPTCGPHIDLSLEHVAKEIWVQADPLLVSRVVLNLLINAVQALQNKEQGRIVIRLRQDQGFGSVEVDDNGPGVSKTMAECIFQPFVSVGTTGAGVGLAAAQAMVEKMGGTLVLEERVGEGAAFLVQLPLAGLHADADASLSEVQVVESVAKDTAILLAEDEPVQCMLFSKALRDAGYRVDVVSDGLATERALEKNPYDMLILGYSMPGKTGGSILRDLRLHDKNIPVVLISGYALNQNEDASSCTRVLKKPVEPSLLVTVVKELTSQFTSPQSLVG